MTACRSFLSLRISLRSPCFSVSVIKSLGRSLSVYATRIELSRPGFSRCSELGPGGHASDRRSVALQGASFVEGRTGLFEDTGAFLELRPFTFALPHPDRQLLGDTLLQAPEQLKGDVFAGRDWQEGVQVHVIKRGDRLPHRLLQIGEVHDHAADDGPFRDDLHFPRVPMRDPALGVAGEKMHAVKISDAADFHAGSSNPSCWNDSIRPRQAS